jgi:hypothetical protein
MNYSRILTRVVGEAPQSSRYHTAQEITKIMTNSLSIDSYNMMFLAKGINVSCRTIESRAYILLEDKNEFFCLNETGAFIWDLINGLRTGSEIIDRVLEVYEGETEEIKAVIHGFIADLHDSGMIVFHQHPFQGVMCSV